MSDPMEQAWSDFEEGFSTLGRMMKQRHQAAGESESGTTETSTATREAGADLRSAVDQLVAAGREIGDTRRDVDSFLARLERTEHAAQNVVDQPSRTRP